MLLFMMYIKLNRKFQAIYSGKCKKKYVLNSNVHIQRVHLEPEAPVLIDLVLPNSRNEHGNLECEKGLLSIFQGRSIFVWTKKVKKCEYSNMEIIFEYSNGMRIFEYPNIRWHP